MARYLQYSNQIEQKLEIAVKSIENQLKVHAEALNLRSQRNEILASNIANSAADLVVNTQGAAFGLVFSGDATTGWTYTEK